MELVAADLQDAAVACNWVFAKATTLWAAFVQLLGLRAKSTTIRLEKRSTDVKRKPTRESGKRKLRGLVHEPLEQRALMAIDVSFQVSGSQRLEGDTSGGEPVLVVNGTLTNPATLVLVNTSAAVSAGDFKLTNIQLNAGTYDKLNIPLISGSTNALIANPGSFLSIEDDATVEDDEALVVNVSSVSGEVTGTPASHTHLI